MRMVRLVSRYAGLLPTSSPMTAIRFLSLYAEGGKAMIGECETAVQYGMNTAQVYEAAI